MTDDSLLTAIRHRIVDPELRIEAPRIPAPRLFGPASPHAVDAAEAQAGLSIPSFLRRIYSEVGNGGFGPAMGLFGVDGGYTDLDGRSISGLYVYLRGLGWPDGLLPLCDWGDGAWSAIDQSGRIITVSDSGPIRTKFTLASWLAAWVSGTEIYLETFEIESAVMPSTFAGKPLRYGRRGRAKGAAV